MPRAQSADAFAADLLGAAVAVAAGAAVEVGRAAKRVKDEARANVLQSAPTHNAGAYRAITYDTPRIAGPRVESEVGYDRDLPGGALGNLLEYGGGGDRSPAHRDIGRAADNEEAGRFADGLQVMARRLL